MRKYRLLLIALIAVALVLGLSTTSLCMNLAESEELVLYELGGARVSVSMWEIREMAYRDEIPNDWLMFDDEKTILDATNGLTGPLSNDPLRAGTLRYSLKPLIKRQDPGDTLVLFISPDGEMIKLMAIIEWNPGSLCDITTLKFKNNRLWPRYRKVEYQHYSNTR